MKEKEEDKGLHRYACCKGCLNKGCKGREPIVAKSKIKSMGTEPLKCHSVFYDFRKYVKEGFSDAFILETMTNNYPEHFRYAIEKEVQAIKERK